MSLYVVGIECATQPEKVGLSLAKIDGEQCEIVDVCTGSRNNLPVHIVDIVADWHKQNPLSLLALDAPLGWPDALSKTLLSHEAGDCIRVSSNKLFLRATDHHIKNTLGKNPLKVGADRIALTAIAALDYLCDLSAKTGQPIPLAWQMGPPPSFQLSRFIRRRLANLWNCLPKSLGGQVNLKFNFSSA